MKKLLVPMLCLVAAGCAKPWPQVEPVQVSPLTPAAGEWRVTDHVVVITDSSGTMAQEALLPEARAVTQSFIAGMPAGSVPAKQSTGYDASLIAFGGADRISTAHARIDGSAASQHRKQLAATSASLRPLGAPSMGGSTPLADVLAEAQAALQGKRGRAALVVISDGIADDPAKALDAARALVSSYPDELCIHTIHMGESAEGRAELARLANLSTDGCGSSRNADSVKTVASTQDLERDVFLGAAPLPPVASRGVDPCDKRMVLRGIQFAFDSAELQPESGPVLDVAADQLRECSSVELAVEGHTCSLGEDSYNQGLSERRATSVRQYLIDKGVSADRLAIRAVGEAAPVASNESKDGRAQNRRVELVPGE